jgi:hypothetical protein
MADPLPPLDVIADAAVRDRANLFVLGCYDRRITFYAQQARELSLVHAQVGQGYLRGNPRIAVVGAGAAGSLVRHACHTWFARVMILATCAVMSRAPAT